MTNKKELAKHFDLSFTEDKVWQKEREGRFEQRENELKDSFRLKTIKAIKHYFMTGQILDRELYNPLTTESTSGIDYFPLLTEETLSFYYSNTGDSQTKYEALYWETLSNRSDFLYTPEESLVLFDFFHNKNLVNGINASLAEVSSLSEVPRDSYRVALTLYTNLGKALSLNTGSDMKKTYCRINVYLDAIKNIYTDEDAELSSIVKEAGISQSFIREDFESSGVVSNAKEIVTEFNEQISSLSEVIPANLVQQLKIEI